MVYSMVMQVLGNHFITYCKQEEMASFVVSDTKFHNRYYTYWIVLCTVVMRIRILLVTLMRFRIRFLLVTLMRIWVLLVILMRIRIRIRILPFTLMRSRIGVRILASK
jgi:hypothetical protein